MCHQWLQWGRVHLNAESTAAVEARAAIETLQWGRVHLNAESPYALMQFRGCGFASMGPRSSERGKEKSTGPAIFLKSLQWGRVHLNAERKLLQARAGKRDCFNGAAFI